MMRACKASVAPAESDALPSNAAAKKASCSAARSSAAASASGKVPAAIHVTPEAAKGGPIGRIETGDVITLNAISGELSVALDEDTLASRPQAEPPKVDNTVGRGLFGFSREVVTDAESGGCMLFAAATVDDTTEADFTRTAFEHCVS